MTHPTIPTIIKAERAKRGMSMRQFATALGVENFQTIHQWEGGAQPTMEILIRIYLMAPEAWARALGYRCLNIRYPDVFINPVPKVPA
jgi:transcriptional regulator with XRE-family HTH domain